METLTELQAWLIAIIPAVTSILAIITSVLSMFKRFKNVVSSGDTNNKQVVKLIKDLNEKIDVTKTQLDSVITENIELKKNLNKQIALNNQIREVGE